MKKNDENGLRLTSISLAKSSTMVISDVNECETIADICGSGNVCDNSVFPYTCDCQDGYTFSGVYGEPCEGKF